MNRHVNIRISEIMTKQVYCVDCRDSLMEAIDVIKKHNIRHLPVLDGAKLVGILSKSDADKMKMSGVHANKDLGNPELTIDHHMTKSVNTIQHDDTVREAAEILSLMSYHALPVLDGENLVGIVSSTDIILYFLKICDE
jgi:acetoin utilization protein AcuB